MGCNPESGHIRELMNEEEIKAEEVLFKHGEIIEIKGCSFKVIQIVGLPHNTITLQGMSKMDRIKELTEQMEQYLPPNIEQR